MIIGFVIGFGIGLFLGLTVNVVKSRTEWVRREARPLSGWSGVVDFSRENSTARPLPPLPPLRPFQRDQNDYRGGRW